ncbi:unnamed protein product [Amoebophrya sp. A25]|nr:unnamed protein product [Amoebophrya sp. A25]|eukprot:GSA25T00014967001.1
MPDLFPQPSNNDHPLSARGGPLDGQENDSTELDAAIENPGDRSGRERERQKLSSKNGGRTAYDTLDAGKRDPESGEPLEGPSSKNFEEGVSSTSGAATATTTSLASGANQGTWRFLFAQFLHRRGFRTTHGQICITALVVVCSFLLFYSCCAPEVFDTVAGWCHHIGFCKLFCVPRLPTCCGSNRAWQSSSLSSGELHSYMHTTGDATAFVPKKLDRHWVDEPFYRDDELSRFSELGHPVDTLQTLVAQFRAEGRGIIFLTGDSALDNKEFVLMGPKYPLTQWALPSNGYEVQMGMTTFHDASPQENMPGPGNAAPTSKAASSPGTFGIKAMLRDVSWWMSQLLMDVSDFREMGQDVLPNLRPSDSSYSAYAPLNAAVAGSQMGQRVALIGAGEVGKALSTVGMMAGSLDAMLLSRFSSHDQFLRANMQSGDVLVVSLGGNDLLNPRNMRDQVLDHENPSQQTLQAFLHEVFFVQKMIYIKYVCGLHRPRAIVLPTYAVPEMDMRMRIVMAGLGHQLGMSWTNLMPQVLDMVDIEHKALKKAIEAEWQGVKVITIPVHRDLGLAAGYPDVVGIHPTSQGGIKLAYGYLKALHDALSGGR